MSLTVSNTLTGEEEVFEPLTADTVTLYYCGLTVSDDAHLGHARSWVHTDVIHRWLAQLGYNVRHVENFTDVNEKIVARVGDIADSERGVAQHFMQRVLDDMRSLNLLRVDVYPRVTEHIPEIISLIERLIDGGFAYETNGSVYFDVTAFPAYGDLSNQSLTELVPQEEGDLAEKRNPQDFALWKAGGVSAADVAGHQRDDDTDPSVAAAGGEIFSAPWGDGRPGWHIECSAMASAHLGETFDIHVAGRDITFPHNENEIAQSVAGTDGEYARYWLHTGLLQTEGEKMSSSLENFFRVTDAVDRFGADVIRTFFLSTRYRSDQLFSEEAMAEAAAQWETIKRAYEDGTDAADSVDALTTVTDSSLVALVTETPETIETAMNDDFDTRTALAELLGLARGVITHVAEYDEYDYRSLKKALDCLETYGGAVFGLRLGDHPQSEVQLAEELIELLVDIREAEREAGNYDRADELRTELTALGVEIEDREGKTTYRIRDSV